MLNLIIYLSISSVLTDLDPCYPTGGPCTSHRDCPKHWACFDDTPNPIDPHDINGICVGNKKIPGCDITNPGAKSCPKTLPNYNVSIVSSETS